MNTYTLMLIYTYFNKCDYYLRGTVPDSTKEFVLSTVTAATPSNTATPFITSSGNALSKAM